MDDRTRDAIVLNSACGYLACVCILFISLIFGKYYGRLMLLTAFPVYSLYYTVMYNLVCRGYLDEVKRNSAFGVIARGTLVGSIYYLSQFYLVVSFLLLIRMFIG